MPENCIFCKIINGEIPAKKLYEDEQMLAFWDIAPQAPKHFLVIPKKHISSAGTISPEDDALIGAMVRKGAELGREQGVEDCRLVFNNGAGVGQLVFHIHLHVLGGREFSWPPG